MINFTINTIYEDNDLLVLDKPSGLIVNKSDTAKDEYTLQDFIEEKFQIKRKEDDIFTQRAGIAHRLDKETSGIILIAKNPRSFIELQRQFKERVVKKTYIALVHGRVEPDTGDIIVPIGRLPWNRKRFGVLAGGREAVTKYKVLNVKHKTSENEIEALSLLELYPETGRTHQIRVHLQYLGYPVFADPLYAGNKTAKKDRKILSRTFLHASKISFAHPESRKLVTFITSLPQELQDFMKKYTTD